MAHQIERSFGVVFAVVFLLIGTYPLLYGNNPLLYSLLVSIVFFALAYLAPKTLTIPSQLWQKLGIVLGSIIAPIVMAFVYFTTVVPIGLTMKLLGKDILHKRLCNNSATYWIERSTQRLWTESP